MFNINDKVKVINSNLHGKIKRINNNNVTVNINGINIVLTTNDIEKYDYIENTKIKTNMILSNEEFIPEIMLRHKTVHDSLFELERFIDKAVLNNAYLVRIIHGKSGGVLRKAVAEYLKSCSYIESYRLGETYEGSYGVTVAKIKR